MEFLVTQGHSHAVEAFAQESPYSYDNIMTPQLSARHEVLSCLYNGEVSQAIRVLNKHFPHVLDYHPEIHFYLHQQKMIEMYRNNPQEIADILTFAEEELAPRAQHNPELLQELERTMGIFVGDNFGEKRILMGKGQRWQTRERVNRVLLEEEGRSSMCGVERVVRGVAWCQEQLGANCVEDFLHPM